MKMEVFVRVHIIEIETGPPECLELWNYFGTRLAAKAGREPVFRPQASHVSPEASASADKI
jgi:hypothetical protein